MRLTPSPCTCACDRAIITGRTCTSHDRKWQSYPGHTTDQFAIEFQHTAGGDDFGDTASGDDFVDTACADTAGGDDFKDTGSGDDFDDTACADTASGNGFEHTAHD